MRRLALAAIVAAVTDLAGVALLGTAAWLIARASQQPAVTALSVAIVAVRALAIGKGSLRYVERLMGHDAALRILSSLRTRVYAAVSERGSAFRRADVLARLVSDVDGVQDALLRCAMPAAVAALVSTSTVAFTAVYLPRAALVLGAGLLLAVGVAPVAAYLIAGRAARRIAAARGAYLDTVVDVVYGAADLAAYGATSTALERSAERADQLARLARRAGQAEALISAVTVAVPALTAVVVCRLATGASGVPAVMVAVLSLIALASVESVLPLCTAAVRLADLRGSLGRVWELLRVPPGASAGRSTRDAGPIEQPVHDQPIGVRLSRVSVRYQRDREPALVDIDIDLPAGTRIAVVGPSGAGKSTLLAVLAGAVAPTSGELSIVGGPLESLGRREMAALEPMGRREMAALEPLGRREMAALEPLGRREMAALEPAERWRLVGGVFADGYVFHASVRENLTLGRPGLNDDALLAALRVVELPAESIELDRVLGEDGAGISGGQRQRLLLARALLQPPPVVVLDEPTEGLEPEAADRVLAAVLAELGNRTVVLVTHRLTDLSAFDEVLVLADGRIAQRGREADLLDAPGWYAEWARPVERVLG